MGLLPKLKNARPATGAIGIGLGNQSAALTVPGVQLDQGSFGQGRTAQDAQGKARLHGSHQTHRGHDHPRRVTGGQGASRGRRAEHAAQAGTVSRHDWQNQPGAAHDSSINPRDALLHAVVVDQIARAQVVRAVEDEIAAFGKLG